MGTWGPGSFENDDAIDWVAELESYSDDGPIIDALNTIIDRADDYPQPLDCSVAIAAAELVAAQLGNSHEDCPEEIEIWVEGHPAPSATRIAQARQAIEVILAESGLKEMWQDSDEWEKWEEAMEDMLSRLPY
ncbi:DUF4259 domain-containing protein [Acaryochloris marina]|uniref:DUF4259 domain-containing protein n=1 Tax=Acaryochloris marina (strain MBIC 11017) TaxID=329726 RepID=A8ZN59_ACAM1|nr:DUF4259 domain-containing protein [Acaryochloris marina]ABW32258.1 hypothetical protein AM1_C0331 [Acaryochloris marina MBIC11017]